MSGKLIFNILKNNIRQRELRHFLVFKCFYHNFNKSRCLRPIGLSLAVSLVHAVTNSNTNKVFSTEFLKQSDDLFFEGRILESYLVLVQFKLEKNDEILWRLSRGLFNMSLEENITSSKKSLLIHEADEYMGRALEINANNYAVHKWCAIILDAKTSLEGTKAKISSLPKFKMHIERAIELNPEDPTAVHMLGAYFFQLADLPWYQKQIASALFGAVPKASFQEALEAFAKAEKISPHFYSVNLLMLGKTYYKLGIVDSAQLWLKQAASYPPRNDEDRAVNKEASEILNKM